MSATPGRTMPIYEFYCRDCHTVFSFFSPGVDTEARPLCPRCAKVRLTRKPSTFATLRSGGGGEEGDEEDPFGHLDEERLEGAMESILGELEGAEESDDPRQMARLLRRFGEAAGVEPGPRMEELLARLDAGADPDALEEEMGGDFGGDEGMEEFFRLRREGRPARASRPRVDKELYFL
jgi:putative FmdB family regulatory protein